MNQKLKSYCKKYLVPDPIDWVNYNTKQMLELLKQTNAVNDEWVTPIRYLSNIFGTIVDARLVDEDEYLSFIVNIANDLIDSCNKYSQKNQYALDEIIQFIIKKFNYYRYLPLKKYLNLKIEEFNDSLIKKYQWLEMIDIPFVSKFYYNYLNGIGLWEWNTERKQQLSLTKITELVEELDRRIESDPVLNNKTCDLYRIDGFVSLINEYKNYTDDFDCVGNVPHNIQLVAYNIGVEYNCIGWLSDLTSMAGNRNVPSLEELVYKYDAFEIYKEFKYINLWKLNDSGLLYLKLLSLRKKDLGEIDHLLTRNNIMDVESALKFIDKYLNNFSGDLRRLKYKINCILSKNIYNPELCRINDIQQLTKDQLLIETDVGLRILDYNKIISSRDTSYLLKQQLQTVFKKNNWGECEIYLNDLAWLEDNVFIYNEDILFLTDEVEN